MPAQTAIDPAELDARIARLEAAHEAVEALLGVLGPTGAPQAGNGPPGGSGEALDPFFDTAADWVEAVFAPTFGRRLSGTVHWCARWPEHPEAVLRLEALWRSWEALRLDPTLGIAPWLRDHLDPQLRVLLGSEGPFVACDDGNHSPSPTLALAPAVTEEGARP